MNESNSRAESQHDDDNAQRIGSYRVLEPLGTGGMSTVYRAVHLQTGHEVALKVLIRSLSRNSTLLQRFLREARSAETLEHPNIVAIFDRGIDEGRHYLVLEYVKGGDFHDYIQRNGPLNLAEATKVIRDVASGLKYAATRGLIHRDIKPSNILRTASGESKIIDLGLALQSEFEDERVTREGTTVGTVDYMAPEQARDSRATSILSDMYSLGCTFYYLLSGVPPFPGGDITDKLTRHARSAAPDIRDLRPDIPGAVAAILLRLLAKNPEDRFKDYDELIVAIDAAPLPPPDQAPDIPLAPLDADEDDDWPGEPAASWSAPDPGYASPDGSDAALMPMESLSGLAVLAGESGPAPARSSPPDQAAMITRGQRPGPPLLPEEPESVEEVALTPAVRSAPSWILSFSVIGASLVILVIGIHQFLVGSRGSPTLDEARDRDAQLLADQSNPQQATHRGAIAVPHLPSTEGRGPITLKSSDRDRRDRWEEPEDKDPIPGGAGEVSDGSPDSRRYLPDWARGPAIDHLETPLAVVRRVAEPGNTSMRPTLHIALDAVVGGTVYLADQGPLPFDDIHISGESRLIRARPGFRPIIHVERSNLETTRQHTAVLNLERKNITLEGIDLIVNVQDLTSRQTSLFACNGSNLTLRNCTITILNPRDTPFTFIRADLSPTRATRIRLEHSVVRGGFGTGVPAIDLLCNQADVVLDRSVILCGNGALVRSSGVVAGADHRVYCIDSVVVGPGPIVDCTKGSAKGRLRPIFFRSCGSAFGRLQGPGIASIISSWDADRGANQQADWGGDRNLYAGWKGFFACGAETTIVVSDLASVRSTWNATERDSQESLFPWPRLGDLSTTSPADLKRFLQDRPHLLARAPQPRPGFFEKTVGSYLTPAIPEPIERALVSPTAAGQVAVYPKVNALNPPTPKSIVPPSIIPARNLSNTPAPNGDVVELVMNTGDGQGEGDLGGFLRTHLTADMKHVRIHVTGFGAHRFTPVQLPVGIQLEIRVVSSTNSEPLSWSSDPQATGPALIEIRGGALVLKGVRLQHDPDSRLENLISTDHAHLVLSQCQLTVPPGSGVMGGLISFRAPTTQPIPIDTRHPIFNFPADRPVCRLADSILIANGTALQLELGRGMVAMSQCAVAAGDVALELLPARVPRSRFEVDLLLERSTIVSERTIIRLGSWPGLAPGPDRPWLLSTSHCAFLTLSERRAGDREAVLLRTDAEALAGGTLFWQASNDVHEVDLVTAAGDAPAPFSRLRDASWYQFWSSNHMSRVVGPRGSNIPNVRLLDRPRPGHIEPRNLLLNLDHHPGRTELDAGANLVGQGISARDVRTGLRRDQ
jgi:eukaryotic-like serine/threonine-protein kinase